MSELIANFQRRYGSDFLYSSPNLLSGISRILDLWGTYDSYNDSLTPDIADLNAIKQDWLVTGEDLREAFKVYLAETNEQSTKTKK